MNRLYPSFRKYAADRKLLREGDAVVAAVSGGVDSIVLLDLLARVAGQLRLSVVVAHVNHGLRGEESDGDEAFVRAVAESRGLQFRSKRLSPSPEANLQDAARRLRLSFFADVAEEIGASAICLGHNRGDQAETILMHMVRGTGLGGLAGMKPRTFMGAGLRLIRPLLFAPRADIAAYAVERGIAFRNDSSNAKAVYRRNDVRQRLMPLLAELNPRAEEALALMAERLGEDEDTLGAIARASFEDALIDRNESRVRVSREAYGELPIAIRRRVLRELYAALAGSTADLNFDQIRKMDAIALSAKSGGEYRLRSPFRFRRTGGALAIERSAPRARTALRKPASPAAKRKCGDRRPR